MVECQERKALNYLVNLFVPLACVALTYRTTGSHLRWHASLVTSLCEAQRTMYPRACGGLIP